MLLHCIRILVNTAPCCAHNKQYGAIVVNESQRIDHAYHEEKLLLLIARRDKLEAGSDQIDRLDIEIAAVRDLVRSYRMVKALNSW